MKRFPYVFLREKRYPIIPITLFWKNKSISYVMRENAAFLPVSVENTSFFVIFFHLIHALYRFQLTWEESESLKSQIVTFLNFPKSSGEH